MTKQTTAYISEMGAGLLLTLLVLFIQFNPVDVVNKARNRMDGILYDLRLPLNLEYQQDSITNIQIVDIDERSLTELGRWPWPRQLIADLVDRLNEAGAIVISFDLLFSEPQQNPVDQVTRQLQLKNSMSLQLQNALNTVSVELDADYQLAASIADTEAVLGILFQHDERITKGVLKPPQVLQPTFSLQQEHLPRFRGVNGNVAVLTEKTSGQGFINAIADDDGFIRSSALLSRYKDSLYPSLALESYRLYSLADNIEPLWQPQGEHSVITGVKIGRQIISTDALGRILIPYRGGRNHYPYTSASQVINGKITDRRFHNAVVFIGTSSVGLADLQTTPVALAYPGVEIHATVFDALSAPEAIPYRPDFWQAIVLLSIISWGLLLSVTLARLSPKIMALTALLILTMAGGINILLWRHLYIDLPVFSQVLVIVLITVYSLAKGFSRENRQRKQVKAIFGQYVPPAHIEKLLESPEHVSLEGEKKELSVLFCDIRNFTSISESLPAIELQQLLNRLFTPFTESIANNQGTIDKYVGDMVMAFWGAPLPDAQHARHAIDSALAMLSATEKLQDPFRQLGWPPIAVGIGINTGEMVVGDMGSQFRCAYTVIGDAVNLGSRLESLTKYYSTPLLVSETTKEKCPEYWFMIVDKVIVKGKQQAVRIFQPLGKDCSSVERLYAEKFNQFFDFYETQQFAEAADSLLKLKAEFGSRPLLSLFEQRIKEFLQNPPPKEWNGAYIHKSK